MSGQVSSSCGRASSLACEAGWRIHDESAAETNVHDELLALAATNRKGECILPVSPMHGVVGQVKRGGGACERGDGGRGEQSNR